MPTSNGLFKKVTDATGLPEELIGRELQSVLSQKGLESSDFSLEDLRVAMAAYLREVILHAKDKFDEGVDIEEEISPEELGQE